MERECPMNRTELQYRLTSYLHIREGLGVSVGADSKVLTNFIDFAGTQATTDSVTTKIVFD